MADINIKMTKNELDALESKLNSKTATVDDYKLIDAFLLKSGLPENYFLGELKKHDIHSFEQLQQYIIKPTEPRNPIREGKVAGIVSGLLIFLKGRI